MFLGKTGWFGEKPVGLVQGPFEKPWGSLASASDQPMTATKSKYLDTDMSRPGRLASGIAPGSFHSL